MKGQDLLTKRSADVAHEQASKLLRVGQEHLDPVEAR
jgi:hypothetical protein